MTLKGELMENQAITTSTLTQSDVHLVARDPRGMVAAQDEISSWLKGKLASLQAEVTELKDAVAVAKQNDWKSGALENQLTKAMKQVRFYTKTSLAVEAGLTIIPNFPLDIFAIRVTKEQPTYQREVAGYGHPRLRDEKPQILDAGAGSYKGTGHKVYYGSFKDHDKAGTEITKYFTETADFQEVAFPLIAARPEVMSATAAAMALNVFDQIGICPQSSKGDPLIIGQVIDGTTWRAKQVSFLIAWYLDLRTL